MLTNYQIELITNELIFASSRSSGPGGQHVNKVNTKIELRFNIANSTVLYDHQKEILLSKLSNKISADGDLIIISQSTRSQLKNKHDAIEKFIDMLSKALKPRKKRVPTKPTKASRLRRLESKKRTSKLKQTRKKDHFN
ncbi:MAG: aminoacyl-tRNA hydrolase [Salinivirgaceae bacterium]|nr:aminoacyl-tRNA hydrolase [Salinivirgaceae bacterium]